MQGRLNYFYGEVLFLDILEMEHIHVLYWLQNTPCKTARGKQLLTIPVSYLEKYLISLEPEYVRVLLAGLHIVDMQSVLYRLTLEGGAKMLIRQPNNERGKILGRLDSFTRGRIESIMLELPTDFYILTRGSVKSCSAMRIFLNWCVLPFLGVVNGHYLAWQ